MLTSIDIFLYLWKIGRWFKLFSISDGIDSDRTETAEKIIVGRIGPHSKK